MALQIFEHGAMTWRQDRPDRIDVGHDDTDLAPELGCLDVFADAWRPGQELSYSNLAVPGKILPEHGFGKIWLENAYVRQSLGYPISPELGGFAVVRFERFNHPRRGDLLVRKTVLTLPDGKRYGEQTTFPNGGDRQQENVLSKACAQILISHAVRQP